MRISLSRSHQLALQLHCTTNVKHLTASPNVVNSPSTSTQHEHNARLSFCCKSPKPASLSLFRLRRRPRPSAACWSPSQTRDITRKNAHHRRKSDAETSRLCTITESTGQATIVTLSPAIHKGPFYSRFRSLIISTCCAKEIKDILTLQPLQQTKGRKGERLP